MFERLQQEVGYAFMTVLPQQTRVQAGSKLGTESNWLMHLLAGYWSSLNGFQSRWANGSLCHAGQLEGELEFLLTSVFRALGTQTPGRIPRPVRSIFCCI